MPFIHSYNGAMQILSSMGTGKCSGACKSSWLQNIRYALKAKSNPLGLTKKERKMLKDKIKTVSKRTAVKEHTRTLKKYKTRPSPPYHANDYCGKKMKGNDGKMYESRENKSGVCSWKKTE